MRNTVCVVVVAFLTGCAGDTPPFEELGLREALEADPQVIAALAHADGAALAQRFEDARRAAAASPRASIAPQATVASKVIAIDAALAGEHRDALIVARLDENDSGSALQPMMERKKGDPIKIEGMPPETAALENRALEGPAGEALRALAEKTGTTHFERVTRWPVAAVAAHRTIYVNGAWLVALGALDESSGALASALGVGGFGHRPWSLADDGGTDGGGPDLRPPPDLSRPPDLRRPLDLAPPSDLAKEPNPLDPSNCIGCRTNCEGNRCNATPYCKCQAGGEGTPLTSFLWMLSPIAFIVWRMRRSS
jgi:hypothetical protein